MSDREDESVWAQIKAVWAQIKFDLRRMLIVAVYIIFVATTQPPELQAILFGVPIGFIVLIFIFPIIPGAVNALANKPNVNRPDDGTPYRPSTFGFFTFLFPGQVKVLERGDRFIRCIMRYDGFSFKGLLKGTGNEDTSSLRENQREFWEIVITPEEDDDSHPFPRYRRKGYTDLIWWWCRYVYRFTGAVFSGIPPFQTVYTYQIERLTKGIESDRGFALNPRTDFSDHVRAAQFQFFVQVPEAETRDQVKLSIQMAITAMVINPYRVIYDADGVWPARLFTAITAEVVNHIRRLPYKEVIAEDPTDTDAASKRIASAVMLLNEPEAFEGRLAKKSLDEIGLKIIDAEVLNADINDPSLVAALAQEATSIAERNARINLGQGEAEALRLSIEVVDNGGEAGQLVVERETLVRAAQAAGNSGGTVILTDSAPIDRNTALLQETIKKGG